jgi:hypothetical protein
MYDCPQAGEWSLAMWEGGCGTDIGEALAACGEGTVDAAYYLSPFTQEWFRWFPGRLEFSNLEALEDVQGLFLLGSAAAGTAETGAPAMSGAGQMVGCPVPGNWSIAVWPGDNAGGTDGTDAAAALDTCGACRVDVAYALDPATGAWQRWFRYAQEAVALLDHAPDVKPDPILASSTWPDDINTLKKLKPYQALIVSGALEPVRYWSKVFSQPFSQAGGNDMVVAMAEFKGDLYALVGALGEGANVYRMVNPGCKIWDDVSPPFSQGARGTTGAMLVFEGHLYAGSQGSGLFRTADGKKWENVTGNLPTGSSNADMAELNGQLYVLTWDNIWRASNDTSVPHVWEPVVGPAPALHQPAFGTFSKYPKARIESLEVFKDHLYAAVAFDDPLGFQLWRTDNGTNWTLFHDAAVPPDAPGWGSCHVHALKAFKDHLYVGQYDPGDLSRTDGSPNSWEELGPTPMYKLGEHAGELYAGALYEQNTGDPLVYSSADGKNWAPVPGSPTMGSSAKGATALVSYGGDLYVGMLVPEPDSPGSTAYLTIYRYGAPALCQVKPGSLCKDLGPASLNPCLLSPSWAPTPKPGPGYP